MADPSGNVAVTSDKVGRVVIQLRDEAYPDRLVQCRLTPQQARELSAALERQAHSLEAGCG